jgi:hypothetical protein
LNGRPVLVGTCEIERLEANGRPDKDGYKLELFSACVTERLENSLVVWDSTACHSQHDNPDRLRFHKDFDLDGSAASLCSAGRW